MRIGDDFQSVFVFMHGGDAAGSYEVLWVLRADGKHSRISGVGSGAYFLNLESGFIENMEWWDNRWN